MTKLLSGIIRFFSSLKLTVTCLLGLMILVFIGTMAQVEMGIYFATKTFFSSNWVWVTWGTLRIPVFPGGNLIGLVLCVNLAVSTMTHKLYRPKKWGLLMSHTGLIILLIGSGLTAAFAIESQMPIQEGQSKSYSQHMRRVELVAIDISDPKTETVTSFGQDLIQKGRTLSHDSLPFSIDILAHYPNAHLSMEGDHRAPKPVIPITEGIGRQLNVRPLPIFTQDNVRNFPTAIIKVMQGDIDNGTWLLSAMLSAPQHLSLNGKTYRLEIRQKRYYNDYSIKLHDFRFDRYTGTDVPKNFASDVQLIDPSNGTDRLVNIYMNHPLRYKGKTYFQASFSEDETGTVLQVVENPGWLFPYVSCTLIAFGLAWHFLVKLKGHLQR